MNPHKKKLGLVSRTTQDIAKKAAKNVLQAFDAAAAAAAEATKACERCGCTAAKACDGGCGWVAAAAVEFQVICSSCVLDSDPLAWRFEVLQLLVASQDDAIAALVLVLRSIVGPEMLQEALAAVRNRGPHLVAVPDPESPRIVVVGG